MIFDGFPREVGFPVRRLVLNKKDFYDIVNRYINMVDIYSSIYKFKTISKGRPDYNTAVVDKIFVDIDSLEEYDNLVNIHNTFLKKNIKHTIIFSGGGFHLYVFIKPLVDCSCFKKKMALKAYNKYLADKFGLEIDQMCVGDLARLGRIPNTYNFKRKRFCIPLDDDIFKLGYAKIKEIAKNQYFNQQIWGSKLVDLDNYFDESKVISSNIDEGCTMSEYLTNRNMVLNSTDDDILKYIPEFPPFLDEIIEKKKQYWDKTLGYKERALIIIWLKEHAYTLEETLTFLRRILTKSEFNHCVFQERQPYYIYRRDSTHNPYHFPNILTLMRDGFKLTREDKEFLRDNPLYITNMK